VSSNDIGYATNNDIINTADVCNFEYNEGFKTVMRPSAFAKARSTPCILKSGVITNPDDFQYDPAGTIRAVALFSKPRGVANPGSPTILGDLYLRWTVRFSGRTVATA
jgi:hypothetical protein